ncbi:lipoate--protein ligase family protein [bacterium]|nr:lipoate--protein ligase family protein [bacterium]
MAKFVKFETKTGFKNMQKDSVLFEQAVSENMKEPILRFYGWSPACVSLGRNQKENTINIRYCKNNNIDVVRRITGGRSLLHQDELTYSFICSTEFLENENIKKSYEIISGALIEGFKTLGIETNFGNNKPDTKYNYCMLLSTGADLNYKGRKIAGSAQYRAKNYILQHGSILYTLNKKHIKNIFNEDIGEKLITLSELLTNINNEEIIFALKNGFEKQFNVKFM